MIQSYLPFTPTIEASTSYTKNAKEFEITTMLIPIPTCLLAELRTHRTLLWTPDMDFDISDFSINANSDRAIPILNKIKTCQEHPFIPIPSLAQKGMTGNENVPEQTVQQLKDIYTDAVTLAIMSAKRLFSLNMSKQIVNRVLAPFSWSSVVITGDSTAWDAFFHLRTALDVDPSFRVIVFEMKKIYQERVTRSIEYGNISQGHISFCPIDSIEPLQDKLITSASSCARISFNIEKNEELEIHRNRAYKCYTHGHFSVFEHQAFPIDSGKGNLKGWTTCRKLLEDKTLTLF
jgi:hypothetical protein